MIYPHTQTDRGREIFSSSMGELMGEGVVMMEDERDEREEEGGEVVVNWHKYLPHMPVRVLLVEGDDSTRQIIAALLRKCSYRVAAVADGMKAWDTLKEKSNNIDLVLTEVELPFLSGFGLLTMIMEHDACKNIPVIMMSSHDSMSMVFKCMLKGAADFLVKPIRKNELSNLWQHVWRRQITNGGNGVMQGSQDMNLTNLEIEDKMNIDKLSGGNGNAAILEKSKELSEQRSDAQSSCTRSDVEAESKHMQTRNLNLSINISAQNKVSGPPGAKISIHTVDRRKDAGIEIENCENEHHLELSLRRFEYQAPPNEQKEIEEKNNKLNHSNSSPFSLYNSRLRVAPVATAEVTECFTPVSNVNLNLTPDKAKSPTSSVQDMPILHSAPIKSVPVPVATGGFPLDQLFCSSIPLPAPVNNQVTDIEEEVEMNTAPGLGDQPEEHNKEMSQGVSDSRSSNVSVSTVGPTVPSFGSSCIGNNEGLRCLTQREIALNKFRLKRKERCFEKKVRYQSRKLLAEKRPRVKGQFVRQDQLVQDAGPCHAAK